MPFALLNQPDGHPVYVNPDNVVYIRPGDFTLPGAGAVLGLGGNAILGVTETVAEVIHAIQNPTVR